jgi:hypothetical protein
VKAPAPRGVPAPDRADDATYSGSRSGAPQQIDFLKRRLAFAIEKGGDKHAEIIRRLVDLLLNGRSPR